MNLIGKSFLLPFFKKADFLRQVFFFEKKNQKTFVNLVLV